MANNPKTVFGLPGFEQNRELTYQYYKDAITRIQNYMNSPNSKLENGVLLYNLIDSFLTDY